MPRRRKEEMPRGGGIKKVDALTKNIVPSVVYVPRRNEGLRSAAFTKREVGRPWYVGSAAATASFEPPFWGVTLGICLRHLRVSKS